MIFSSPPQFGRCSISISVSATPYIDTQRLLTPFVVRRVYGRFFNQQRAHPCNVMNLPTRAYGS